MKKLNTIIAASLLAVTAGVASAGCNFETNTPGAMTYNPDETWGNQSTGGTGKWRTIQGATVSIVSRNVNNIIMTQAGKNKDGFNKQQPAWGEVWRAGSYDNDTFTYDAKYNYRGMDATGKRTSVSITDLNNNPISGPVFNWNNENSKLQIGNVHSGNYSNTSLRVTFDIRGVAKMRDNPVLPDGNYVATHEIWCIQ